MAEEGEPPCKSEPPSSDSTLGWEEDIDALRALLRRLSLGHLADPLLGELQRRSDATASVAGMGRSEALASPVFLSSVGLVRYCPSLPKAIAHGLVSYHCAEMHVIWSATLRVRTAVPRAEYTRGSNDHNR